MKRVSLTVLNPSGVTMKHSKHMRRHRRANPSGKAAAQAALHTVGKIVAGAVTTYVGKKALAMKKDDGTTRLTAKQQLLAQGVVAVAAGIGGSMVDNKILGDVLDGTAIVMGGDAAMAAAHHYNVEGADPRRRPGHAARGDDPPALPAPTTAPGGYVYAQAPAYAQPGRN